MSIEAMQWAWNQPLKSQPKILLLRLADQANSDGTCWPGKASLSSVTGLSQSSVKRYLKGLQDLGLISADHRWDAEIGRNRPNLYTLHLDATPAPSGNGKADKLLVEQPDEGGATQTPPPGPHRPHPGATQTPPWGHTDPRTQSEPTDNPSPSGEGRAEPDAPAYVDQAERVVSYLNARTGRAYKARKPNGQPCRAVENHLITRFKEGYTPEDAEAVIDNRVRAWGQDPKMAGYLRPETLFRASKFEDYLGQAQAAADITPEATEKERQLTARERIKRANRIGEGA